MSKRSPRLQFSEEEQSAPELKKAIQKAEKKADKLDKAEAKIPKKTVKKQERVVDADGKVTTRLYFEEVDKKKPPSKMAHEVKAMPVNTVLATAHREVRESEDDNVGVESAHKIEEVAEGGVRTLESAHRAHQLKPYRGAAHAEAQADKANLQALNKEAKYHDPQFSSNPYSRWQQKRAIKKEYMAAKAGHSAGGTAKASEIAAKATKKSAESTKKVSQFFAKNKKTFLLVGGLAAMLAFLLNVMSSCSIITQSTVSAFTSTTYPVEDSDMRAAEAQYCALEDELREYLDTYEDTHDYDEYYFELDDIEHDPYVLISMITALKGGEWTIDEVGDTIQMLFERQYILTETVETETRYRTETETGERPATDPYTGDYLYDEDGWLIWEEYEYEVEVPYTYYTCTVTLENFNLSHVPIHIMSKKQLSMYARYMATLGNRPDLFPSSAYVNKYYYTEYEDYEIPPEALEDEQFAAMIEKAEEYLGYPYVWGGSSPSTSFDCSGFVSWVLNNCGVGWDVGRLGASGLLGICTRVTAANVRPGDLIFFEGTYDTTGASHVGIYVGNNMMIHCGDPIQYASIDTSYWREHFLAFGRLPDP